MYCVTIVVGCDSMLCIENSVCVDSAAGPECVCNTGFMSGEGGECEDINECDQADLCGENAKCENLPGFFQCICDEGFRKSGGLCISKYPFSTLGLERTCFKTSPIILLFTFVKK